MKYLILEAAEGLPWILLFTAPLTHADVAAVAAPRGYKPVSAGYYDPLKHETFGESSTLKLKPRPADAGMIAVMAYNTARYCPGEAREI